MKKFGAIFLLIVFLAVPMPAQKRSAYFKAAFDANAWIQASAIKTEQGTAWPANPLDPKSVSRNLYSGTPGVILFLLETYHSTNNQYIPALLDAKSGADYLMVNLDKEKENGLYTGIAGIGFALTETYKASKDDRYRQAALRVTQILKDRANRAGKGIEWNDTTDIIAGSAGIGLFLLYAARELGDGSLQGIAADAGRRLIELGQPEAGGTKWAMNKSFPRLMPNFSHGTAGIAYFLATLYQETKQKEFLDAALAGATYLKAVAKTDGDICMIFHNEPEGKDLYYLSWCHGPAGTARLFYRLYQVTGDKAWMELVKKSARAIMKSGIPEKETPGYWNNVSQCCGAAGVGEFFLSLYQITKDKIYLEFIKRVTDNLLARSAKENNGLKWIQAENRRDPDVQIAQTGFMQGAAGIGMFLLRLDARELNRKPGITFPDSPF
ncbi:MAG: lanthionine synthetase LanC family protein [Acidobacteriota bacterium]